MNGSTAYPNGEDFGVCHGDCSRSKRDDAGGLDLHVLASGSKGNAALVVNRKTGEGVLVDCGICKRDFFARCDEAGFDPSRLQAILITHEHTDHTKGLGVVLRGLASLGAHPQLHASRAVCAASTPIRDVIEQDICEFVEFEAGARIDAAGVAAHAFATSHDAAQSFGFRFECEGDALGFMTDTGIVTPQAHDALQEVRVLAIESNHDEDMLWDGPYPYPLKCRVASEHGHLSNAQAARELSELLSGRLETVIAMHVSQNNNTYELPREALSATLACEGHPARVLVALQGELVSV